MPKRKGPPGTYWRGNTFWGRAQVRGQEYRWSLRTDDPAAARRRYEEDRKRIIAEAHYGEGRRTLQSVMDAWKPWILRSVGPRTAVRYSVSLGQLQPILEGLFLDEINGALVARIIRERGIKATNATVKRDLVALSSVIGFAIDQGWQEDNPVLTRMKRIKERRDPIVLPDPEHIRMVIDRAPGMIAFMIEAAWRTGARQSELVNARRGQLSDAGRELTLHGKRNKVRVIDLEPFGGYDLLRSLPAALRGAFLFWHDGGQRYANVASRFRAIVKKVAEKAAADGREFRPFRFHDLRHRHAVDWLKSGRSIYDLQHRLGHDSIKTTEVYLAFLTPEQARVVKQGAKR